MVHLAEEEAEQVDREAPEVVLPDELVQVHVQQLEDDASMLGVLEVVPQPEERGGARARVANEVWHFSLKRRNSQAKR